MNDGELKEAEISIRKAIELNPKDPSAYVNLGGILINLGKLKEAVISVRKSIELNPNYADAHYILGNLYKDLDNLQDAEVSILRAIELNPKDSSAHTKLAGIFLKLGKLKEAEISIRKAVDLNPNNADAHYILGNILKDQVKLEEAEVFIRKAIKFNSSELALCYQNLSLLMYAKGKKNIALDNIKKALSIDPISKDNKLLISILKKHNKTKNKDISTHANTLIYNSNFLSYPITINKPVAPKLVNSLYQIQALDLNRFTDPSYGKARGSDYQLFEDNENITTILEKELTEITKKIVNSDVLFHDSFFTILSGNSTVRKHNHLGPLDKFEDLNLWKQKYSLVYYLSVGDQDCQNPGILKFYKDKKDINSSKEILPYEGMLVIFPADIYHSVKYDGNKDSVIIGVNFYSI